jgi:hypothetical protein
VSFGLHNRHLSANRRRAFWVSDWPGMTEADPDAIGPDGTVRLRC